ncbi:MAG: glycine cleavage system protein T, partial [Oscillospiraceae bacterium]|nr:glycine cleavage system protein T [Oscillospiraceae bacterium]
PDVAMRLERNNIVCNYQATPEEEGFTASGALRMGVNEMTRFGFGPEEFDKLAQIMADCILRGREVGEDVTRLRENYREMRYCFSEDDVVTALDALAQKSGI